MNANRARYTYIVLSVLGAGLVLTVLLAVLIGAQTHAAPPSNLSTNGDPAIEAITVTSNLPISDTHPGAGLSRVVYFNNAATGTLTLTFRISGTPPLTLTPGTAFGHSPSPTTSDTSPWYPVVTYSVGTGDGDYPGVTYTVASSGNRASTVVTITYTRDITPPLISSPVITEYSKYLYHTANTHFFYTNTIPMGEKHSFWIGGAAGDNGSGLARATFSPGFDDEPPDDTTPAAWEAEYDVSKDDSGDGVITATVYDNVGNFAAQTFTYTLDGTPPTSTVTAAVTESIGTTPIEIGWTFQDDGCGVESMRLYHRILDGRDSWHFITSVTSLSGTVLFTPLVSPTGPITYGFASSAVDHLDNVEPLPEEADTAVVVRPLRIYLPLVRRNYPPQPRGSVVIEGGADHVYYITVTLTLSATVEGDTVEKMRFSNDGVSWGDWEDFKETRADWRLAGGSGIRTVYAQFMGNMGGVSKPVSDAIELLKPSGRITIAGGAATVYQQDVNLTLSVDGDWAVQKMRLRNEGEDWGPWEAYTTTKPWGLTDDSSGLRRVYAQFKGSKGEVSEPAYDAVYLAWNGDFESEWIHWEHDQGPFQGHGTGLDQAIVFEESNRARLGNPDYQDGNIPVGYAYIAQEFIVPDDKPHLSFQYQVHSRDTTWGQTTHRYFDTFEVSINRPPDQISDQERDDRGCHDSSRLNPTGLLIPSGDGLVFCGGQLLTAPPEEGDSGWCTVSLDLSAFAGEKITLYIATWSREYEPPWYDDQGYYNTYSYVDNIIMEGGW